MPYPTSTFVADFVGEGVFENDADFRAVAYLDDLAGLNKLTPTASANGDKMIYSLHAGTCSSNEARELVRSHLDSGILHKLTAKMVSNYFNPLRASDYTCWGYVPVILAACAMSHGCRTLYTAPGYKMFFTTYKDMLVGILPTAPLMDPAKEQMKKALQGPDGFEPGTPVDFGRFALPKTYSSRPKHDACMGNMLGGIPIGYKPTFKEGGDDDDILTFVGPCSKEDMQYSDNKKLCGGCEIVSDKPLMCSKCRDQVYCSKDCQREDFGRHKVCCRRPEDAQAMKDKRTLWHNSFFVSKESMCGSGGFLSEDLADKAALLAKQAGMEHVWQSGCM